MRPEEATDFMSATLTRRFGLKGGLAWLGLLTFGVVAEQVKTRLEVASDEQNTVAVQVTRACASWRSGYKRDDAARPTARVLACHSAGGDGGAPAFGRDVRGPGARRWGPDAARVPRRRQLHRHG